MPPPQLNPQRPRCSRDGAKCQPQTRAHDPLATYSSFSDGCQPSWLPGPHPSRSLSHSVINSKGGKFPHPPATNLWQKCSELRHQDPELRVQLGLRSGRRLCWDHSFIWPGSSCWALARLQASGDTRRIVHRVTLQRRMPRGSRPPSMVRTGFWRPSPRRGLRSWAVCFF